MDDETQKALKAAAAEAKIRDLDLLRLDAFAKIVEGVKTPADVPAAIVAMKAAKPGLFEGWSEMGDSTFATQERALLDGLHVTPSTSQEIEALVVAVRAIDASKLSKRDFETLDRIVAAVSRRDWSRVDPTEVARLQKVTS